jgi:hypothetical protein
LILAGAKRKKVTHNRYLLELKKKGSNSRMQRSAPFALITKYYFGDVWTSSKHEECKKCI